MWDGISNRVCNGRNERIVASRSWRRSPLTAVFARRTVLRPEYDAIAINVICACSACVLSPFVGSLYWHDPSHVMQAKQVDWRTQLMRGIKPSACLPGSNAISILLGENEECESGGLEFEKRFEDDVNSKASWYT